MPSADDTGPDHDGPREVTLDQALELAATAHRAGDADTAERVYRRILEVAPEHADALHFLGVLHHQTRRSLDAVRLIRRAIAIAPEVPSMHTNLGNVLMELDRPDLARHAYQRAIELDPAHLEARNNLGVAFRVLRRPEEAEAAYTETLAIAPEHREAWNNLGRLLGSLGRTEEAIQCHTRALKLRPRDADTRRVLVASYAALGRTAEALEHLRDWLTDDPTDPTAQHLLAAISGENVPARAADRYVATMFDEFAASFDHKLAGLDYRAPELVAGAVAAIHPTPSGGLTILDAGCGTGLCGPLLRPYAARLEGVDLSGGMLEKAARRGGYDALEQAELTQYLGQRRAAYDLVVSADTLCYFGALAPVFAAANGALRPGGHLVFSVETEPEGQEIHLQHHGRYSHGRAYVERALTDAGFTVVAIELERLRMERGRPVAGLVVTAANTRDTR